MDLLVAIDTLDDLVHNARAVPLTDQVRLKRGRLDEAFGQIQDALPLDVRARAEADGLLERLDRLVTGAKPVPLTGDVRFDKQELYDVLDALRALIGPENR